MPICDENCVIARSLISSQSWLVSVGQTDGRTVLRATVTERAKNGSFSCRGSRPYVDSSSPQVGRHCNGLWPAFLTSTNASGPVVACGSIAIWSLSPAVRSSVDSQSVPTSCEIGRKFTGPISMHTKWWSLGKPLQHGGVSSIDVPDQKFGFCMGATGLVSMIVPWSALPWDLRVWIPGSRWPEAVVGGEGDGLFDDMSL